MALHLNLAFLAALLIAAPALAQQPPPQEQALGQEILACVGEKVQLRGRVVVLEVELAKLKPAAPKAE